MELKLSCLELPERSLGFAAPLVCGKNKASAATRLADAAG
jgi:hypothetical protein